ncbi:MAG: HAMP domain-containing histidine kinase [Kofleriaceae bacterium]|nr:MAG: HAMP domain-containing histidine kinase [Kofleriaceae bacterium]MBZ0231020.1 HAMP domain-containing histidine kinase [Kofleriaceae bacterium]
MTGEPESTVVDERTGRRMIILAVVVTVAAFLGASWAALSRLHEIRRDSRVIAASALPSIQSLSAARRKLGHIGVMISQLDRVPLVPGALAELRVVTSGLAVDVNAYFAVPTYAGEREDWWAVLACIEELRTVLGDLDASSPVTPSPATQARLAAAVDRADATLLASMDRNADQIEALTAHIESTRASAVRRAVVFNAVGVVLAGLLLAMALRSLRRQIAAERRAQQLLEARATELEAFAGRVAHDLVAPLTPTFLWLERLRASSDPTTRNAAERALRGVGRATELVDALFTFARAPREAHPAASSDLDHVAREVLGNFEELAITSQASLELVSPGPVPLEVHPGIVSSVLGNLVQNAIRYLGDAPVRRVTVRLQQTSGRARVEVADTGPGIATALQERIFDPYFRAAGRDQPLGLGLGLATARRLVEAHGGTIGVWSLGAGATFWFELPLASGQRA